MLKRLSLFVLCALVGLAANSQAGVRSAVFHFVETA